LAKSSSINEAQVIADYATMSCPEIADKHNTYVNKIIRILKRNGVKLRSYSESTKLTREKGTHPTAGRPQPDDINLAKSKKMVDRWANLGEDERERVRQKSKRNWEKKTPEEKAALLQKGTKKCRETTHRGSKLERYIAQFLIEQGIKVEFHKNLMSYGRLEVDIYLPKYKTIVQVNGPSHFKPIWGQESFDRQIEVDKQKLALVLRSGFLLIQVNMRKQTNSQALYRKAALNVCSLLGKFDKKAEIEVQ
jgi:very-short-patch-repair endonuclease